LHNTSIKRVNLPKLL